MRKGFMILAMAFVVMESGERNLGAALQFNPICFSTLPFQDKLVWNLNSSGGNQLLGSGRDHLSTGDRSETVAAFINGDTLTVGFATHPQGMLVPVIAGGTISISTETGPGQCYAPDFASCGSFTFTRIDCSTVTAPASATDGPIMGGVVPSGVEVQRRPQ